MQEEWDRIWVELDGESALEHLCRIASIQFTLSVTPADAVPVLNRLWASGIHKVDYPNDPYWQAYISESLARYHTSRYSGPEGFDSLEHYVAELAKHDVVMLDGQACRLPVAAIGDHPGSLDLFLRSVWWHHRLRRYGKNLTVETRPFARRTDDQITPTWQRIQTVLSL